MPCPCQIRKEIQLSVSIQEKGSFHCSKQRIIHDDCGARTTTACNWIDSKPPLLKSCQRHLWDHIILSKIAANLTFDYDSEKYKNFVASATWFSSVQLYI